MYAIETNNLTKTYGKYRGVDNINLKVKEGEIFGFIGPNGAGKSTTMKLLLNFIFPTVGEGKIFGKDIISDSKEIKCDIGYVPSEVNFYGNAKVIDILKYAASFKKGASIEDIEWVIKDLEIEVNKKMEELSLGNKKKVAIAQALIGNPRLLILDEPTNGLDPLIHKKVFDILVKAKECGVTIFLSSHNLNEVENYCDRVSIIKEGKIIETISIDKIQNSSGLKVTLMGDKIDEGIFKKLQGVSNYNRENDKVTLSYKGNINELLTVIAKFNLNKVLIEEQSLEETFLNYYENGESEE